MEVVIVTGASKGLGEALVERLLSPQRHVVGIARQANDALVARAASTGASLAWHRQDLSDAIATDALAASVCAALPADATRYTLVNNAATAEPIGPIVALDAAQVVAAVHLNLTSAMLFTARFLAATASYPAERRVLNVSSGLARRPMDGSAVYCATKAALDMFTRCINVDAANGVRPAKAVALAPGVIDTGMQGVLRGQDPAAFPEGRHFRAMKDEGRLSSAADVAAKIADWLAGDAFGAVELDDIRNH